jgi:hypothetical protein
MPAIVSPLQLPFVCEMRGATSGPVQPVATAEPSIGDDIFGLYFGAFACFSGRIVARLAERAQAAPQALPDCTGYSLPLLDERLDGIAA